MDVPALGMFVSGMAVLSWLAGLARLAVLAEWVEVARLAGLAKPGPGAFILPGRDACLLLGPLPVKRPPRWRVGLGPALIGLGLLLVPGLSPAQAEPAPQAAALDAAPALPDYASVRRAWRPSDRRLLAADGSVLQQERYDFSARRGAWVPLAEVSFALQRAVIQSEDRRFYEHAGVDWRASAAAAWDAAWGTSHRGASTLSMQLAALLDAQLRRGPQGRGLWQKWQQMQAARQLESRWSKAQILEAYLNLLTYRGELLGVDALSRVLFQKRPSGLTLREAALAAVLLRGPNAALPVLVQRSCALLRELGRPAQCDGLRAFVQTALARSRAPWFAAPALAPHWAQARLRAADAAFAAAPSEAALPRSGADGVPLLDVRSSLDRRLQQYALDSVRRHLADLRGTGVTDAAVVALDNRTGAVLAYVGSSGALSAAPDVDHAQALRQAGSTLKPFLYALALDEQRLTAASLLDDRPLDLDGGGGLYVPDNYDHRFSGWVSVRTALASSLNVPAVRALVMVGADVFAQRLLALGLPLAHDGDYYGYSLALGSADVTLLSLTNAYRALARGGDYAPVDPQALSPLRPAARGVQASGAQAGTRVFSAAAAWVVGDILADRQARARTFGLDSPLSTPFWSAVKTGTSRDMRDNWCLGWSARYTVGVWVGNSAGASMRHVSGVSGAGPIWRDVMTWLARASDVSVDGAAASAGQARPVARFGPPPPAQVSVRRIRFEPGIEPARLEYFLADTAQSVISSPAQAAPAPGAGRIAEPVDGTILAWDPDIPPDRQRVRLRAVDAASRPAQGVQWYLDGKRYAQGLAPDWAPQPGTHVFELRDEAGTYLDRVRIHVRNGG